MRTIQLAQTEPGVYFQPLIFTVIIVCVTAGGIASSCTRQEARDVADAVRDLAAEVCVEHDSVSVCLKKCAAAAERDAPASSAR